MDHHYGTEVDPAHFVELDTVQVVSVAAGTVEVAPRPAAGGVLLARDAVTHAALASITIQPGGFWSATYVDTSSIDVSADNGASWVGPLFSSEALSAAVASGEVATQALAEAQAATATANAALAAVGTGGGGPEFIWESAAGVYPAPVGTVSPRIFVGQVRPTEGQGRRERDFWWNTVVV